VTPRLRWVLAGVWGLAAAGKVLWPCPLLATLAHVLPGAPVPALGVLAWAAIVAEGACAVDLASAGASGLRRAAAWSAALGALLLLGYLAAALRTREFFDCPCFGFRLPGGAPVTLLKSGGLVAASALLWRCTVPDPNYPRTPPPPVPRAAGSHASG
jgi:hypothetical protein